MIFKRNVIGYIAMLATQICFIHKQADAVSVSGPVTANNVSVVGDVMFSSLTATASSIQTLFVTSGSIPSFTIIGTTWTDNAPSGYIGELVSSVSGVTNFPSSGVWGDLTSITLSPGDWDVSVCAVTYAGTDYYLRDYYQLAISTTSGNNSSNIDTTNSYSQRELSPFNDPLLGFANCIAPYRVLLSATTTVFLKYMWFETIPSGVPTVDGRISARRVR